MIQKEKWVSVAEFARSCGYVDTVVYSAIHTGTIKFKRNEDGVIQINLFTQKPTFMSNYSKIRKILKDNRKILKDVNRTDKSAPEQYQETPPEKNPYAVLPQGNADEISGGDDDHSNGISFLKSRSDKEKALARKAQLECDEKEGKLISADLVVRTWKNIAINVQKAILSLPDRIAPLVVGETDQFKIREKLDLELKYALRSLSFTIKNGHTEVSEDEAV